MKPPFGIAQQGKSFRNEITVEHFTFRSCEFEQMEMEFFIPPPQYAEEGKDDMYWYNYWCQERLNWYVVAGHSQRKVAPASTRSDRARALRQGLLGRGVRISRGAGENSKGSRTAPITI